MGPRGRGRSALAARDEPVAPGAARPDDDDGGGGAADAWREIHERSLAQRLAGAVADDGDAQGGVDAAALFGFRRTRGQARGGRARGRGRGSGAGRRKGGRVADGGAVGAEEDDEWADGDGEGDARPVAPLMAAQRGTFTAMQGEEAAVDAGDNDVDGVVDDDDDDELGAGYGQGYFERRRVRARTSNFTLGNLAPIDDQVMCDALRQYNERDPLLPARQQLQELLEDHFERWAIEATMGFNLLFYGLGSKRALLDKFVAENLGHLPVVAVSGYFPNLNVRSILHAISDKVLGERASFRSHVDHAEHIIARAPRMVLLVHSIDGPALRPVKVQQILSRLATAPSVRVVASCDHINVGVLWDSATVARYNFVWHDSTTFAPLDAETTYETSIFGTRGQPTARSVGLVLRSLNANARGVFALLAAHLVGSDDDDGHEDGMTFDALYTEACVQSYLARDAQALNTLLQEFKDHEVIRSRRAADGTELLYVPLDRETLRNLLKEL